MSQDQSARAVLQGAIDAADLTDVLLIGEDAKGVISVAASGNVGIAEAMLLMELLQVRASERSGVKVLSQ